jgi:hypothetical protein
VALQDDDFVVFVPRDGAPVLAVPGDDISDLVGRTFTPSRRTFLLKGGRSAIGSINYERALSAEDEISILALLNEYLGSK